MAPSLDRKQFLAVLLIFGMWAFQATSRTLQETSMSDRHKQWMVRFGRVYKDNAEKEMRSTIFKANVELIESFKGSYKLAVNAFADQTNEEFQANRNGYKMPSSSLKSLKTTPFRYENVTAMPPTMNERKKGVVTPVKDQGQCAATEDQGCEGGEMENVFEFIVHNKGINSEAAYPYSAADGTCNTNKEAGHAAKNTGYEKVPANSEAALLKAVANQPISVSIDASRFTFQFYSSGVFTRDCGTDLHHGVTADCSWVRND